MCNSCYIKCAILFQGLIYFDSMKKVRRQLTLFVEKNDAEIIEQLRMEFNPAQYRLIKSHVTLCREEELEQAGKIAGRLSVLNYGPLIIDFGPAERFSEGKGVWLPGAGNNEPFHALRKYILQEKAEIKNTVPHITLIHPRNASCTDNIFETIKKANLPQQLLFKTISLIEQENDAEWKLIDVFKI